MSCSTVFKKRSSVFRTHFHWGYMSGAKLCETCDPCLPRSDPVTAVLRSKALTEL
jgi:hypothetical protein